MKDPYLYKNTNILINRYNINNENVLSEMEAEYTSFRIKQLSEHYLKGKYDLEHFKEFHKWIFQDIYEWAGESRIIDIEKPEPALGGISIEYAKNEDIEKEVNDILSSMKKINWDSLSLDDKTTIFSKYMADIWKTHAFREGNTRTVITFFSQYADENGFPLDRSLFEENNLYVRTALVAATASFSDLGDLSQAKFLEKIIKDSMISNNIKKITHESLGNCSKLENPMAQSETPLADMNLDEALIVCKESYDAQAVNNARDPDFENEIE